MIKLENVTRKFGDLVAVNNVSFEIQQGEIVGLLGHNGAGKTTVMKMLTGFLESTSGSILVDGLYIGSDTKNIQTRLGYLPENCPLWSDMSIIDYLSYQASLHNLSKEHFWKNISYALDKTKLTDRATQLIRTLSKGYKQRVGVAQAILHKPSIIILDEPTNGLDPTQTMHMRELILELAKKSTVILSTHIMQEVQAICERVIIMRNGVVAKDIKLEDLNTNARTTITIDKDENVANSFFLSLPEVHASQLKSMKEGKYQYILDADSNTSSIISGAVHQAGYKLYEIKKETQTIESVFSEVNSQ